MANLTAKELTAVEDSLNQEQLVIKKLHNYAATAEDPQIRACAEQLACRHKQHFDLLMSHLS